MRIDQFSHPFTPTEEIAEIPSLTDFYGIVSAWKVIDMVGIKGIEIGAEYLFEPNVKPWFLLCLLHKLDFHNVVDYYVLSDGEVWIAVRKRDLTVVEKQDLKSCDLLASLRADHRLYSITNEWIGNPITIIDQKIIRFAISKFLEKRNG